MTNEQYLTIIQNWKIYNTRGPFFIFSLVVVVVVRKWHWETFSFCYCWLIDLCDSETEWTIFTLSILYYFSSCSKINFHILPPSTSTSSSSLLSAMRKERKILLMKNITGAMLSLSSSSSATNEIIMVNGQLPNERTNEKKREKHTNEVQLKWMMVHGHNGKCIAKNLTKKKIYVSTTINRYFLEQQVEKLFFWNNTYLYSSILIQVFFPEPCWLWKMFVRKKNY